MCEWALTHFGMGVVGNMPPTLGRLDYYTFFNRTPVPPTPQSNICFVVRITYFGL